MEEMLKRINELARKAKETELTDEEKAEQKALREKYVKEFREGFRDLLLNTKVVDEEGREVTPEALKKAKEKK